MINLPTKKMDIAPELTHHQQYDLSIRFASDGFSLYVYDEGHHLLSTKKGILPLFSLSSEEIVNSIGSHIETQLQFKNTRLICESNHYCLVPRTLFVAAEHAVYSAFGKSDVQHTYALYNEIPSLEAVNTFRIPVELYNGLATVFGGKIEPEHHLTAFLQRFVAGQTGTKLYAYLRQGMIDVAYIRQSKLYLLNSFAFRSPEDAVFNVLNVLERFEADIRQTPVFIHTVSKQDAIISQLSNYVASCQLLQPDFS